MYVTHFYVNLLIASCIATKFVAKPANQFYNRLLGLKCLLQTLHSPPPLSFWRALLKLAAALIFVEFLMLAITADVNIPTGK